MLPVVEAFAALIRWHLRPHSRRRILNDIPFLCTGLRPVILMDYGGTMPQLQGNLCTLLQTLLSNTEENGTVVELVSIQYLFSAKFPVDAVVDLPVIQPGMIKLPDRTTDVECTGFRVTDRTSLVVDLSAFLEITRIALPSLNGWLLGYAVTYLFSIGNAERATQNLSKHTAYLLEICGHV